MEERKEKNLTSLVIIFGIVIILLLAYIFISPNFKSTSKSANIRKKSRPETEDFVYEEEDDDDYFSNLRDLTDADYDDYEDEEDDITPIKVDGPAIEVLSMNVTEHDSNEYLAEIKNISDSDIHDASSYLIFYDASNKPIYVMSGENVYYFKKGDTKYLSFYDFNVTEIDYASFSVVLGDYYTPTKEYLESYSLVDQVKFDQSLKVDEYNDKVIAITGKNSSSEDVSIKFKTIYYDNDKIIYIDTNYVDVEANSNFSDAFYYSTEYDDSVDFPKGFTYKVVIDYVEPTTYFEEPYYDDYYYEDDGDYYYDDYADDYYDEDDYDYDYDYDEDEDNGIGDFFKKIFKF